MVCEELKIKIKIIPNSSKNDIIIDGDCVKVKVTAQPVENKANKALIEFLSKTVRIPKSNIEIVKGLTSKEKTVLMKFSDINKKTEAEKFFKIKKEGA